MILIKDHDLYCHIVNDDSSIDLVRTIKIDLYDSFTGFECEFKHLDGTIINQQVAPFHNKTLKIVGKGLLQGNLLLKFKIQNSTKNIFKKITEEERYIFINILKKLYKDKYY
jgi:DnaJ-class molecular chaperone